MKNHKIYWSEISKEYNKYVGIKGSNVHEKVINPSVFELLGDTEGKIILDAACGNGYLSALMSQSAQKVFGIDFTEELIREAKNKHSNDNIEYAVSDVESLPYENNFFDIVVCNMSLMDFENLPKALNEISRVLKLNGKFIASILHPCFENPPHTESLRNDEGVKKARIVSNYFKTGLIEDNRNKDNAYQHYHYVISDYINHLAENRLFLNKVIEPNDSDILKDNDETPAPYYLIFKAVKLV